MPMTETITLTTDALALELAQKISEITYQSAEQVLSEAVFLGLGCLTKKTIDEIEIKRRLDNPFPSAA